MNFVTCDVISLTIAIIFTTAEIELHENVVIPIIRVREI